MFWALVVKDNELNKTDIWAINTYTNKAPTSVTIHGANGNIINPSSKKQEGQTYIIRFNKPTAGKAILTYK